MGNEFELTARIKQCGITPGQIVEARNNLFDRVYDLAKTRWPQISDDLIWQNLATLDLLHKYHVHCGLCMGANHCPSLDATRTVGRLAPNGWVEISQEKCPRGYRIERADKEEREEPRWKKRS